MSTTFDNDNITFDNNNTTFDNLPAPTTSKIKLKKSSVPEKVPLAGDLEYGELALNFADGKLYFKNSVNEIESFLAGASSAFGTLKSFLFIATQGQDTFTGSDNSSETLSYNPDYVDVFVNGIRLNKQDYNTPNSQTIVLNTAVTVNDEVAVTTTEVTGSAVNGTNTRQVFTATEAQTVFVLTKDYDIGFIDVYQNGVKLVNDVDVDVSSGTEIVLTTGAASGDTIDVVSFAGVVIADHFTKTESDNRFLPQVDPAFTGTLSGGTIDATVTYDNAVSGLTATDVQAAIDEVTGDLANIDLAASNVTYNNSTSGLTATDVQAAIDEVEGRVDSVETGKVAKSGDTMTGGLYTNSANSTMVASNGTANQEFANVFATSANSAQVAAFVSTAGEPSVWWARIENGVQIAKGAVDAISAGGGLTLWANNEVSWYNGIRLNGGTGAPGSVDLPLQPIISGQMGTAMTNPSSAQKLAFDEFFVSRGITYNSSTRRFTVPIAGQYRITLNPFKLNSAGATRVLIGINNDAPAQATHFGHCYGNVANTYDTFCLNSVVTLAAGDFIVFYLREGALYNQSSDRFNQFTIEKIA